VIGNQKKNPENIIIKRECLQRWDAVNIEIANEYFEKFLSSSQDRECQRAIIKGNIGRGASYDGRIDIYDFRGEKKGLGTVRLMRAVHEKGQEREEKHGEVMQPKNKVVVQYSREYSYIGIDPDWSNDEPHYALILAKVDYKTTLKGLGRQIFAKMQADNAIWHIGMSSSARSGRFGTYSCIAIVNDDHPVFTEQTGDVKTSTIYNLSSPQGAPT
jgi:hypothetical protein